jgi:cytochrome c biogenesis protein CcdA
MMDALAPATAFAAGAMSSFGPCAAPRYVALASIVNGTEPKVRFARIAAFAAGLCCCSTALAFGARLLWAAGSASQWIYAALAAVFAAYGVRTLIVRRTACTHRSAPSASVSAAFLIGSSFAFVFSPCCAPVLVALATFGTAANPGMSPAVAGAFVAGHALPVVLIGSVAGLGQVLERRFPLEEPVRVTSGALMLAISAYYGVLA